MPHLFRDEIHKGRDRITSVLGLERKQKVGDGGCVALVKMYTPTLHGASTSMWRPGARVIDADDLTPGTALATFFEGKWPAWRSGNHAAYFVRVSGRENGRVSEIVIMDQYNTYAGQAPRPYITTRKISVLKEKKYVDGHINMSNDLEFFYVIK
jgi:hypothetical protein